MKDESDVLAIAALGKDELLRLRTTIRNEIAILVSDESIGGPNTRPLIEEWREKLHAIASRLEQK